MIKKICIVSFSAILFLACSKSSNEPTPPAEEPPVVTPPVTKDPLRLMKKVLRGYDYPGGTLTATTTVYTYDDKGRITSLGYLEYPGGVTYEYDGDILSGEISHTQTGSIAREIRNHAKVFNDGDSIQLTYVTPQPGFDPDTVQLTYVFKQNVIQRRTTYLHFHTNPTGTLDEYKYTYDASGKLTELRTVNGYSGDVAEIQVVSSDDKVNIIRSIPKFNYILMGVGVGLPLTSQSLGNVLKFTSGGTDQEFEYTYNDEGYPLTVKKKGDDYIFLEFTYNR